MKSHGRPARGACSVCREGSPPAARVSQAQPARARRWYAFVDCAECGFRFVHPAPDREELDAWYRTHFSASYGGYMRAGDIKREHFRARLDEIEPYVAAPGRLLDVGCAAGYLLEVAQDGWDVQGVELNPLCESSLPPSLRGRVAYTALDQAKLDGQFDLITLFDVLEHSPDPRAELAAAVRWLAPDGWLAVQVPCIDSAGARFFGRRWYHYAPPAHLAYFSRATLGRLADSLGLEVAAAFFVSKRFSTAYLWSQVSSTWLGSRGARVPLGPLGSLRFPVPLSERLFLLRARSECARSLEV